ncbi:hypothetical protein A9Q87_06620 [Flavobacteriales bacterium 34_180_T64]|nr:hypothetical protein A9Q87_06620 [Flavobacteriales bacterium 34_180_T64]
MKAYVLLPITKKNSKITTIFSMLICLIISTTLFSQNTANTDIGVLDFEAEIIDYGSINKNDNGLRTFKFTNRGTAPIIIADVKTTCGCTIPKFSKKAILPGETGEIEIKYDTKRVGVFSKTITVLSNADETSKKLKIKGTIIKPQSIN